MPDQFTNEPFAESLPDDSLPPQQEPTEAIPYIPVPEFVNPLLNEVPVEPDDTQPRAPVGLRERLAAAEPPLDPMADTAETYTLSPGSGRWLLAFSVLAGTLCLCALMVGSASYLGYRDGLATNNAKVTQTLATGIAEQYATGIVDLAQGRAELAVIRLEWIVETLQAPTEYAQDSAARLNIARTRAAYTATPAATATPTASPTLPAPTNTPVPPT
ncbi:MAG: hypothetical protein JXA10_14345, partial [Anaerolineae bacterium]|nr:hypothetical protein [Anaerolineae bacterium]